jgi:hypothetical protein
VHPIGTSHPDVSHPSLSCAWQDFLNASESAV